MNLKLNGVTKAAVLGTVLTLMSTGLARPQEKITINVDTKNEIADIQPNMYGIFFEDINFAADGGLYAEMIKNRSFDFPYPFTGWMPFGDVKIMDENPLFDNNPNYICLTLAEGSLTGTGLDNEGFRGIGLKKDEQYRFSFYAKSNDGKEHTIRVELVNSTNDNPYTQEIKVSGGHWEKYTTLLTSNFTDAHSRVRVRLVSEGSVCMEHISMFPVNTWKGRENGMRADLAEALYNLKPGVFRFPGGCIVEGTTLETRYQWKNSVGSVENRPLNINRWNYTFPHKAFHDYYQSYGLGFYEYFLLCEDFGSDALPIISCGIACQYETGTCVPLEELQSYIDDALDLIEFANGDVNTTWGKVRAEMGHPEPFGLKMIGIGNEQWGEVYPERLEMFQKSIKAKYPEMIIVGSSGPSADGKEFDYLWPEMKRLDVELVDEHYYKDPQWFFGNAGRYDDYDRKGPKVFAGEYASHDYPNRKDNNFLSALSEAAFMTGLERNADVVYLATYAPLFAHVDAWQWNPDLIWFDNMERLLTPNYYVQQLYALYKGTNALKTTSPQLNLKGENNIYASSVIDKDNSRIIVKVVNSADRSIPVEIDLSGNSGLKAGPQAEIIYLQTNNLKDVNTFDDPLRIAPKVKTADKENNKFIFTADKYSFNVVVIDYSK